MFKDDFIQTFGEEKWKELQIVAHSNETPPDDETCKVAFRMLEMLDWHCYEYGDSHGMGEDTIRNFLKKHRKEVGGLPIPPPSYIGLICGNFDFLKETECDNVRGNNRDC